MNRNIIISRIENLLDNRGLESNLHIAVGKFRKFFIAFYLYHFNEYESEFILKVLEDDDELIKNDLLFENFRGSLFDYLLPNKLKDNIKFKEFIKNLLDFTNKGIGIGEMVLPLVIHDYEFSAKYDGKFRGGSYRVQIKQNGASLKPITTGLTDKGLVDRLNKEFFNGNPPGYTTFTKFKNHYNNIRDAQDQYYNYFTKLYPNTDTQTLVQDLVKVYHHPESFNNVHGKWVLSRYKDIEGWNNLMMIDNDKHNVVNICDINDIESLNIRFSPKFYRGKDTQALPDGYVNIFMG